MLRWRNELLNSNIYFISTKQAGDEHIESSHNTSKLSEGNAYCPTVVNNGLVSSSNRNEIYSLSGDQQRSSIIDVSTANFGTLDLDASKCSRSGVSLDSKYSFSPTNR